MTTIDDQAELCFKSVRDTSVLRHAFDDDAWRPSYCVAVADDGVGAHKKNVKERDRWLVTTARGCTLGRRALVATFYGDVRIWAQGSGSGGKSDDGTMRVGLNRRGGCHWFGKGRRH
uniref:Uncharacterized protein n=1 Tax=Oryza brachyantha TaxID=4533 RepID=J3LW55_ORYBR